MDARRISSDEVVGLSPSVLRGLKLGPIVLVVGYRPIVRQVSNRLATCTKNRVVSGELHFVEFESLEEARAGEILTKFAGLQITQTLLLPLAMAEDKPLTHIGAAVSMVLRLGNELNMFSGDVNDG
ncbi:hypothetical protein [Pseudaestuariivita atlantica]|jgi:hypothetical protein|nr:hypothetical protein [Pseudaestuariivita atlantica]